LLVCVSAVLKDVPIDESMLVYVILLFVSFVFSFFYMIYFTSTLYTSNQDRFLEKEKLSVKATFILFIVFILGILVLQSRVRKFFN